MLLLGLVFHLVHSTLIISSNIIYIYFRSQVSHSKLIALSSSGTTTVATQESNRGNVYFIIFFLSSFSFLPFFFFLNQPDKPGGAFTNAFMLHIHLISPLPTTNREHFQLFLKISLGFITNQVLKRRLVTIYPPPPHLLCPQALEERLKQEQREEVHALKEAHRRTLDILRQQSEQELQTLRFELEDEGKAKLGKYLCKLKLKTLHPQQHGSSL